MRLPGGNDVHRPTERRYDRRHFPHARNAGKRAADRHLASKAHHVRVAGIALALLISGAACSARHPSRQPVAITRVSVVDVVTGATNQDYTVVLSGNRITYAGP